MPIPEPVKDDSVQRLVREMILQLKRGYLDAGYFRDKFHCDILKEWESQWQNHAHDQMLAINGDRIQLTRKGLLHADALLPPFFEQEHQGVRYT